MKALTSEHLEKFVGPSFSEEIKKTNYFLIILVKLTISSSYFVKS